MAAIVDHEKRKKEILEKAFKLFIEEGYEDVTYQKIADKCGITRTTLYTYFRNKLDIFLWSIKQIISEVEQKLIAIMKQDDITSLECLRQVLFCVIDEMEQNKAFFKVLKMFLAQLEKKGEDVNKIVTRRVIRFRHLMTVITVRGQKAGEIKKLPIRKINALFYSLLETGVFKLGNLDQSNLDEIRDLVLFSIDGIRATDS